FIHSSFGSMPAGMEINGQFDVKEIAYLQSDARGQVSRQKAELSRVTSENLLDAADAYIDLLAALSGAAIAREAETKVAELLESARRLAKAEPGTEVQVEGVESELYYRKQVR